jgi:uncharacterized Zn-binding protein involved in type VI secretion
MVSTGATLFIATVVLLVVNVEGQRDQNVTRYVALGEKSVVRLPEQVPVKLDCWPPAVAAYGQDLNLSSIQWFRKDSLIVDNSTVRNVAISPTNLCLFIDELTIASGAEDGTEAEYTCRVCRNEPPSPRECRDTVVELIASSPPILECADPTPPDISGGFVNLPFGCDLCLERGQSVFLVTLACQPITNRQPTNCTIRNPDGETAQDLDDGDTYSLMGNTLAVSNGVFANPEDPLPPTVLGDWTCTCINRDGMATAVSKIGSCLLPPIIDKGDPKAPITEFPPYYSEGSRTFKVRGNDFVLVGNQFTVTCNILQGTPPPTIMWLKDGVAIPNFNSSVYTVPVNKSTPGEAAGRYTCTATNEAGSDSAESVMRLGQEIVAPPLIRKGPFVPPPVTVNFTDQVVDIGSDVYIIRGRDATINCELSEPGLPPANITWTKNGRPLSQSLAMSLLMNMNRQLMFSDTTNESDAYYCCMAENVAGADEACSGLFIRGGGPTIRKGFKFPQPVNPEVIPPSPRVTTDIGGSAYAVRGADLEVMCPVTFAEPEVTMFTWTLTDSAGTDFPITVIFDMVDPITGEMFGMTTVDGNPVTVYQDLERQTSRIVINTNTTGFNISCAATSVLGEDSATTNFAVYAPPVIDEGMPSILPQLVTTGDKMSNIGSTFHVVRGGDVVVDCPSSGAIPVNSEEYVWYYKGMMVMDQTNFTDAEGNSIGKFLISTRPGGSTLTIKNAARSDNGYVQCSAFNPAGSDFASSRIRVYDEVLIDKGDANDTIGPSELTGKIGNKFLVPRGRRAFINCNFAETGGFPYNESVNLPAAVEWFFNGVPLSASLYSQIHGNQLCFDTALFNFTGVDDTVQCKSTSRISEDGVMGQMDSETSNIMIVEAPVINRNILADPAPNTKVVGLGTGTRRVVEDMSVRVRCELTRTGIMPMPDITWLLFQGDTSVEIENDGTKYTIMGDADESELTIMNFMASDEGRYRCTAENIVGSDTADVMLRLCPADSMQPGPCPRNNSFVIELEQENPDDLCPYCAIFETTDFGPCFPGCHAGTKSRLVECFAGARKISNFICANRSDPITPEPASTEDCSGDFPPGEEGRSCLLDPRWKAGDWTFVSKPQV